MVHINLTCIYARKDTFIQQHISSHLERLHLEGHLDAIQFMEVHEEAFAERRYTREEREADIYLVLISPHLLATPFIHSGYLKKEIAAHQLKQIKMIPIIVADGDFSKTPLNRLERLNSNQIPLKNEREFSLEANLTILTEELKLMIIDWRDKKQEFEDRWSEAQEEDKRIYYENFLKDYPHGIYRQAAKKRFDELKELELWQDAKAFDKVHYYYLYLRDAPLQQNRVDAIQRITEIELTEKVSREDALQSESLPLLFDYKVRFPKGEALGEVKDKIQRLVEDKVNHLNTPEYIQTEAYYLHHLAFEKLDKNELLSMRLLLDYTTSLKRKSRFVIGGINETQSLLAVIGLFGIAIAGFYLGPLLRYAVDGTFGFRPITSFVICVLGAFLAIRSYTGFLIANKDKEFCRLTTQALERSLVTIKISAIDHDQLAIFQETLSLLRIEKRYKQMRSTGLFAYLFDRTTKGSEKQEEVIRRLPLPLKG